MAPMRLGHARGDHDSPIFFGQQLRPTVTSANHVSCLAVGQNFSIPVANHFVRKHDHAVFRLRDARADAQLLVIPRGVMIAAVHVGHHNAAVIFLFHFFVFHAQRAHQLHAAYFKPDQKVGVIDDSHLVRFGITHAHFCIVIFEHSNLSVYSGLPCQTGLRFSRNEARPSLKSGVQRMRAFSRMARSRSWSTLAAADEVIKRFARERLPGLAAINTSASSLERVMRFSAGTISFTSPNSFASAASRILPVSKRSRAFFSPICRVRKTETIAGRKPIFTSVYPNFASGTAKVKSHSVAITHPPASAAPLTAATWGRGKLQMRRNIFAMRRESS